MKIKGVEITTTNEALAFPFGIGTRIFCPGMPWNKSGLNGSKRLMPEHFRISDETASVEAGLENRSRP
ncbi:hypothetical protein H1164_05045 [Thermoactinomyces daqus]|uniref:Uncharacterized protein n=1 Tax=Thermoactinomyces daqus TaxID=1329516 RepID=A0A7W1X8V5_9BACL|nr:hypothetical protein [Thermoactinomyces daqus]MBA4542268.1 hypothetical protein [Thermoactinomyces daqus]